MTIIYLTVDRVAFGKIIVQCLNTGMDLLDNFGILSHFGMAAASGVQYYCQPMLKSGVRWDPTGQQRPQLQYPKHFHRDSPSLLEPTSQAFPRIAMCSLCGKMEVRALVMLS